MADAYKEGDLVQLKSGGPSMVIRASTDSAGDYHCSWFRGATKETGWFKEHELQAYTALTK